VSGGTKIKNHFQEPVQGGKGRHRRNGGNFRGKNPCPANKPIKSTKGKGEKGKKRERWREPRLKGRVLPPTQNNRFGRPTGKKHTGREKDPLHA